MNMQLEHYTDQMKHWPQEGRHILAHQRFGGDFSYSRMSWIKPNFLWMMFRAGWGTKEGQEHILAVTLRRAFFERLLERAVASGFAASGYADEAQWKAALSNSDVRLQWDPDHDPFGRPVARRAVQLGLRGAALAEYGGDAIVGIEDVTAFVREQHAHVAGDCGALVMPRERVYVPGAAAARNLDVDAWPPVRHE